MQCPLRTVAHGGTSVGQQAPQEISVAILALLRRVGVPGTARKLPEGPKNAGRPALEVVELPRRVITSRTEAALRIVGRRIALRVGAAPPYPRTASVKGVVAYEAHVSASTAIRRSQGASLTGVVSPGATRSVASEQIPLDAPAAVGTVKQLGPLMSP